MYTVSIKRGLIAQHWLIGGNYGMENQPHSHHYQVEARLEGADLDEHGYLVDIVDIEANLEAILGRYRDRALNDLPEFSGLNPSVEHFARIVCQALARQTQAPNLSAITVRVWETESAWASFRQER